MTEILYKESLKQMNGYLTAIVLALVAVIEIICIWSFFHQDMEKAVNLPALIVVTILMVFLAYAALFMRTTVTVTNDRITIKTIPTRTIMKTEITSSEIECIKALRQYGGWGVRMTPKKRGYISDGAKSGVMLHLKGKNDTMISSNDPEALLNAINSSAE